MEMEPPPLGYGSSGQSGYDMQMMHQQQMYMWHMQQQQMMAGYSGQMGAYANSPGMPPSQPSRASKESRQKHDRDARKDDSDRSDDEPRHKNNKSSKSRSPRRKDTGAPTPPKPTDGGMPPESGGGPAPRDIGFCPSMSDLAKDIHVGGSGQTVQDSEVTCLEPSGRVMLDCPRCKSFEDAPFPASIKSDLAKAGFPSPSQIQQYTWPLSAMERDVVGVAATGSGKTLAFLLPAFSWMMQRQIASGDPTLLVLAPTRELAIQIEEEAVKFGRNSGMRTACIYGGAPKPPQADAIRSGVHGIIGTPGRVHDFLEGGQLHLDRVVKLVLDEADRMLDMGFEPQIRKILAKVPTKRHTLFFTATWPTAVRRVAQEFLRNAVQVQIGSRDELKGNQDIIQVVKICTPMNKHKILVDVLQQAGVADGSSAVAKGLVFCGTKKSCDQMSRELNRSGVPCAAIHGDKGQREREQALGDLKSGQIRLLVATDVAARGLDIKGVTLVVNYDLPANAEDYVHRIGRTGRAGQRGYAVALVTDRDAHFLKGIIAVMKRTGQEITPEVEQMADRAGPAPPPVRRGNRGGGGGSTDVMCGDFQRGVCNRGDSCKFSHGGGMSMGMPPMGMHPMAMPPMGMPGYPMAMPMHGYPMGMPMPGMPPMGMPNSASEKDRKRGRDRRDRSESRKRSRSRKKSRGHKKSSRSRDRRRKRDKSKSRRRRKRSSTSSSSSSSSSS